ncbi:hypothetical protein J1605_016079 [Eschrichtius robustus]|uniref:Uncharacterized protein n=1 Tax=Eschrichtius robustus TaxID=9764 RepID=A0AB34G9M2_ESCRO|nr:hypothetical protein J1605_016079 [Eschrichtius robustus]
MWDLPRPGLEPVSPALAGRFSTTVPPGKPQYSFNVLLCVALFVVALGKDFNYSDPELIRGYSKYGFNSIISKNLGNHRDVPDTRNKMCHKKQYPSNLPTASIVICFHNEEFNALFRTVSSVMTLTPQRILEEVILVDDMSEFASWSRSTTSQRHDHLLKDPNPPLHVSDDRCPNGLIYS